MPYLSFFFHSIKRSASDLLAKEMRIGLVLRELYFPILPVEVIGILRAISSFFSSLSACTISAIAWIKSSFLVEIKNFDQKLSAVFIYIRIKTFVTLFSPFRVKRLSVINLQALEILETLHFYFL